MEDFWLNFEKCVELYFQQSKTFRYMYHFRGALHIHIVMKRVIISGIAKQGLLTKLENMKIK